MQRSETQRGREGANGILNFEALLRCFCNSLTIPCSPYTHTLGCEVYRQEFKRLRRCLRGLGVDVQVTLHEKCRITLTLNPLVSLAPPALDLKSALARRRAGVDFGTGSNIKSQTRSARIPFGKT
eukprot:6176535-Pleurochrysis_carterae.AAC.3